MAKDDYHVIVYKLLAYLYRCLKDGEAIQADLLEPGSRMFNVNQNYWGYIMENMQKQGYIEHITLTFAMGHELMDWDVSKCRITPQGIEYLQANRAIKRAYEFLRSIKEIIPIDIM